MNPVLRVNVFLTKQVVVLTETREVQSVVCVQCLVGRVQLVGCR